MHDLKPLIAKLNRTCRTGLEKAAERCMRQTYFAVEIEHLLVELAAEPNSDLVGVLAAYGIDRQRFTADLEQSLARLKSGNTRTPALSDQLVAALAAAWTIASIDLGITQIRSGCIVRAVLEHEGLRGLLLSSAPEVAAIPRHKLMDDLPAIMRASREEVGSESTSASRRSMESNSADKRATTPALDAYTFDLTREARSGRIDPIVAREPEIRQIIDILMRRRQNNPILTGDAGVGKTAIVEGFAQRVVEGSVPPSLAGIAVRTLDLGLLQAGAGVRGEFEQRFRAVIEEVASSTMPTVLFIDEAHTLIGAGGQPGQSDAANLLKPALARGELRTIAATTWGEYKRYFEKDPALARRFQVVKVAEPTESATVEILRGLARKLESFHDIRILEAALTEATRLSHRYIPGRQLPDKAISVLDTACARVAIAQTTRPAALTDVDRRCAALETELTRLRDQIGLGGGDAGRMETLAQQKEVAEEARDRLASRWQLEREIVDRLRGLERRMQAGEAEALRPEWDGLRLELEEIQQSEMLVPTAVDGRSIAEVVSGWTGVPVGAMLGDSITSARTLKQRMAKRIVGQDAALDAISRRIQTFYADMGEPGKPTGVFLLCGPSGVGKTETALTLAELLFGGQRAIVTVNMSEYQEAHSVSGLKGAPPGYVGYGKGGVLTEAVRRQPYCVLLLDEVEKAHPDVLELFYQVFDRGMLEDSEGALVDFSNTVILLTSNAGADALTELSNRQPPPSAEALAAAIRPGLLRHFPAAFLGRLTVVPYRPLGPVQIEAIVRLKLTRIQERFAASRRSELTYDEAVVKAIAARAGETESGARTVDAVLTHTLLPELSGCILDRIAEGGAAGHAHIGIAQTGAFKIELEA
ncbi:MAG TPA: type VI secretion system ATPase TssH [Stellaceae bacterium]